MAVKFNTSSLSDVQSSVYTIEDFNGVDYTTTPTKVDDSRATEMSNYLPQGNGLVKRNGWKEINNLGSNKIYNIWKYNDKYVFYTSNGLYHSDSLSGDMTSILEMSDISDTYSFGIVFENRLFLLLNDRYLIYDGTTIKDVKDVAYIPTTIIGIGHTDSYNTASTLEEFNLLKNACYVQLTQEVPIVEGQVFKYDLSNLFNTKNITSMEVANEDDLRGKITFDSDSKSVIYTPDYKSFYNQMVTRHVYPNIEYQKKTITDSNINIYT